MIQNSSTSNCKMKFMKLLSVLRTRNILQERLSEYKKPPEPVRLSFTSYEYTKTPNINETRSVPPVVIMHGLFGSKQNWKLICKVLSYRTNPTRKIIAVDARNHGDSTHSNVHTYEALALDVKKLLEAKKINKISFMGHSMGGRTAMYFALKHPEFVEQLIVIDISPVSTPKDMNRMYTYFKLLLNVEIPQGLPLAAVRRRVDAALRPNIPNKSLRGFLLTNLIQKSSGKVIWRLNLKSLKDNYHDNIGKFPIEIINSGTQYLGPVTFIAGSDSDFLPEKDYTNIKKLFPKAVFHTIKEAGHWVHSEKPAELLKLILRALNVSQNKN